MLAAIDLDDQSGFEANEIDNVCVDGLLPPERLAILPKPAQPAPELTLGVGHVLAKSTRIFGRHGRWDSPSSSFG
jgi:hypothetical protein